MSPESIGVRGPASLPVSLSLSPSVPKHKAIDFMEKAFKRGEGNSRPLKFRCKMFAQGLKAGYKDSKIMMIFFEVVYAIPARFGKVIDVTAHIPYVSLATVPLYFYHTATETVDRMKTVYAAIKVRRWSDAFYYFLGGSSRGAFATNIASKPVEQGFKCAGMGEDPVVNLVFKKVIPSVLFVTSALSGIRKVWDMTRTVKAYGRFKRDANEPRSLKKVFEIFEKHWDGPSRADFENEIIYGFETKTFRGSRSTSGKRYGRLKGEMDTLKMRTAYLCLESFKEIEGVSEDWRGKVQTLRGHIEKSETMPAIYSEIKLFEELIDEFSNSKDDKFKAVSERLEAKKSELEELVAQGDYVIDRMKSEMHRKIVYNALEIMMSILMISGGALALAGSPVTGAYFTLGSAIIDTIYLVFDRIDDEDGFRKVESLFRSLTPAPDQLVALP